ncbi:MAG: NifU family protein, partial [Candidatus Aenigmarchaeota archaeon]|nr:NifU family protein [Candidatus Aenigmarchaeota archaeon]
MVFKKLFSVFRKKDDITITETKPEVKAEIASTEDEMNAHEQPQAKEEDSSLVLNESLPSANGPALSPNEPGLQQALAIQLFDPTQKRPAAITPSGTIITHSPFDPEAGEQKRQEITFEKQPADEKELWDAVNKVIDARIRPMIKSHEGEIELVKI